MQTVQAHVRQLVRNRRLDTLVENRQVYHLETAELYLYETHQAAQAVDLRFADRVVTSMIEGRKVMHLPDTPAFDYLPGETLMLPEHAPMAIDFPDATLTNPTRCLALALSSELVQHTLQELERVAPRVEGRSWHLSDTAHRMRDAAVQATLHRLVQLLREDHPARPLLARHNLQELVIRMLQHEHRRTLLAADTTQSTQHRLAWAASFIRERLPARISLDELSDRACLSRAQFFRCFRQEFGLTPTQFILLERIRLAKQVLAQPNQTVSDACFAAGFNSLAYFDRMFKRIEGVSPGAYKRRSRPAQALQTAS